MPIPGQNDRTFSSPSPGQILKGQSNRQRLPASTGTARTAGTIEVGSNPFASDPYGAALIERGVLLAPLLVQWSYKVASARPFAKWLKTKELLMSDARLGIDDQTLGVHYFGTYIEQPAHTETEHDQAAGTVNCQTLWGFSDEDAMNHMFELCRGTVERVSIVESDLRDFVTGLKTYIQETGSSHFSQNVLLAPAAV
jgi:hypothetical protein